jgi:hypothetical protein
MTVFLSLLSLLAAASTAPAGPASSASCVLDRLSPSDAAALAIEGATLFETGTLSPDAGSHLAPAAAPTAACMALHHWTADQMQLVLRYTLVTLAQPSFEATMQRNGMNPARLTAIYRSLPVETRTRPLSRADIETVMKQAQDAGLVRTDDEHMLLGRYLGFLNIIDTVPLMLACPSAATPPTADNPFPEAACGQP